MLLKICNTSFKNQKSLTVSLYQEKKLSFFFAWETSLKTNTINEISQIEMFTEIIAHLNS